MILRVLPIDHSARITVSSAVDLTPFAFFRVRRLCAESRAQDLVEYALMAGFVAMAAGALMPGVSASISVIFSKVISVLADSARTPTG